MSDDAPIKGKFKGGDPVAVGKLGGRPKGSKNQPKDNPLAALPPKKQQYALLRAKGESKKDAALKVGYSLSVANSAIAKIETEDYRRAFEELMRQKIPAQKIIRRIREGMSAIDTKFATQDGKFTDHRDVINWPERRKMTQLAAEMTGAWVPKAEMETTQKIDEGTLRRLMDINDKLNLSNIPLEKMRELEASHVPLGAQVIDAEIAEAHE